MKEEKIYEIGQKLGISEIDIRATLKKNRYKIVAGVMLAIATIAIGNFYEPLHYGITSVKDFNFFTRFF